jgi:hypothetical protein
LELRRNLLEDPADDPVDLLGSERRRSEVDLRLQADGGLARGVRIAACELRDQGAVPVRLGLFAAVGQGARRLLELPEVELRFRLVERVIRPLRIGERAPKIAELEPRPGEVMVKLETCLALGCRQRGVGAGNQLVECAALGEAVEILEGRQVGSWGLGVGGWRNAALPTSNFKPPTSRINIRRFDAEQIAVVVGDAAAQGPFQLLDDLPHLDLMRVGFRHHAQQDRPLLSLWSYGEDLLDGWVEPPS